jgi:thiol-disulfide isomerase/thioredoxin
MKTGRIGWMLAGAAVIALALGALVAAWRSQDKAQAASSSALLALELPDAAGAPVQISQFRGKVLVVNFWATWCTPCREEMPSFVEAQSTYGPKGLQFVGIAVDDAAKVKQFASEINLNYPSLIGGYGAMELSKTLGNSVMALPFTVVIGRDGNVARTQLGPLPREQLATIINQLL